MEDINNKEKESILILKKLISKEDNDFNTSTIQNKYSNIFIDECNKSFFSIYNYVELNPTIPKENFLIGNVKRHNSKISISEDSNKYHFGNSNSISIGKENNVTRLEKGTLKEINTGKISSVVIGNSKNKKIVSGDYYSRIHEKVIGVKNYSNEINFKSTYNIYARTKNMLNMHSRREYKDSVVKYEIGATHFSFSWMPLKGHFTLQQNVAAIHYADMVHYENLWRIFNFVHKFGETTVTISRNIEVTKEEEVAASISNESVVNDEDCNMVEDLEDTCIQLTNVTNVTASGGYFSTNEVNVP